MKAPSLSLQLLAVASLCVPRVSGDMTVTYLNNKLFYKSNGEVEDRGLQTLWGMLRLVRPGQPPVPNVTINIAGTSSDWAATGDDHTAAFWRKPGENTTLWPDHDFWGWPSIYVPPWPLYRREILQAFPRWWTHRHPRVYWTGTAGMNHLRYYFVRCSEADPARFQARNVNWGPTLDPLEFVLLNGTKARPKRMMADLREAAQFQWSIYFPGATWSSSIKRIAATGAALILPKQPKHESFFTHRLQTGCPQCFVRYDEVVPKESGGSDGFEALCAAVLRAVESAGTTADVENLAGRLRGFVNNELGMEKVEGYMLDVLKAMSERQAPFKLPKDFGEMKELSCPELKRLQLERIGPKFGWQLEEWYDDECNFRSAEYLQYTAL